MQPGLLGYANKATAFIYHSLFLVFSFHVIMKFSKKRLFQSKTVEDNDVLSHHFKEQCELQRRINATMPHLRSRHHQNQPFVCIKANGAIVFNRSHHTSIPSEWKDDEGDEEETIGTGSNPDDLPSNGSSSLSSFESLADFSTQFSDSHLSRSTSLPSVLPRKLSSSSPKFHTETYQLTYEQKIGILLEEMDDVQQESFCMKKKCQAVEQRCQRLEQRLAQRDQLILDLQSRLESFVHSPTE